jgi:hypothetical protein
MSGSQLCITRDETTVLFPKQSYNVLSPSSYTHITVRDLNTYFQDQSAYSAAGKYVHGPIPKKEYINGIFLAVQASVTTHECFSFFKAEVIL